MRHFPPVGSHAKAVWSAGCHHTLGFPKPSANRRIVRALTNVEIFRRSQEIIWSLTAPPRVLAPRVAVQGGANVASPTTEY
jgi:hypothetical protein